MNANLKLRLARYSYQELLPSARRTKLNTVRLVHISRFFAAGLENIQGFFRRLNRSQCCQLYLTASTLADDSIGVLSCLMAYISRLMKSPKFIKLAENKVFEVSIVLLLLAGKFLDDTPYSTERYAEQSLLPLQNLIKLEVDLIKLLDWNVHVSVYDFNKFLYPAIVFASDHCEVKADKPRSAGWQ
ncbi:hypothetical protein AAMO2058_000427900 [Amorphochlora amoebiformis]